LLNWLRALPSEASAKEGCGLKGSRFKVQGSSFIVHGSSLLVTGFARRSFLRPPKRSEGDSGGWLLVILI